MIHIYTYTRHVLGSLFLLKELNIETHKIKSNEHCARFKVITGHYLWRSFFKCFLKP